MKDSGIERFVSAAVREAAESAIQGSIRKLNLLGRRFEPADDGLLEWREPHSNKSLSVTCVIAVSYTDQPGRAKRSDPVVDSFIARAESGNDKQATLLNLLEGDINNGGFLQVYQNKGIKFIKRAVSLLEKIGSRSTLQLVTKALVLLEENEKTLTDHENLRKLLYRLDCQFYDLKESIPVLFEKYRKRQGR